jgi:hypothetical protein
MMNMVWSHVDEDTATADTLQRVDVSFANSTNPTEAYPIDEDTSSYLNYFLGHCPNGITNVHGSAGLLFTDVYPDIDVLYSSNNAGLKLLFIINPGASIPQEMGLAFAGDNGISVLNNWVINVHTTLGDYEFEKPHVYQIDTGGNRIALPWHLNWNVVQSGEAGFTGWGSYDGGIPLIIEIAKNIQNQILHLSGVEWATPVGGFDNDVLSSCTNDPNGNFFVTGYSNSSQFPITPGQIIYSNQIDVLTAKFGGPIYPFPNPDTDRLMWTTFFGGPGDDKGFSIATKPYNANSTYNVYIVGETSSDIAIFNNGNSSSYNQANNNGNKDAFLLRLDNNSGGAVSGSRWSTLIGGTNDDIAKVVKIDVSENIYICGQTKSNATTSLCQDPTDNNFPLCHSQTSGIFDNTNNGNGDGFLMIFNSNEDLLLSTFYGGDGEDIINGITIDNNGKVYFCGNTSNSTNFPLQTQGIYNQTFFGGGGFDGFITKLNSDFSYAWSMLYGGSDEDNFNCMDHDSQNNIYIVGRTKSNQPASTNAGTSPCPTVSHNCQVPPMGEYPMCDPGGEVFFQKETNCNNGHHNGDFDGTITEFNEDGELKWSTYYGGNLEDNISGIAINNNDLIFIVGTTHSQLNFPYQTHGGAYLDSQLPPTTGSYNGFLGEFNSDINHYHKNIWASSYNSYDNLSQYIPFNEEINAISVYGEYWFIAGSTEDAGTNLEEHICCPMAYQQGSVFGKDGIVARFWESGMWMPWVTEVHKTFGKLIIYPNPAINIIKINLSFIKLTPYSIIIYNSSGKICYSESKNLKVVKDLQEISCENFSNGLYYLQVLTEEGSISSKFIINR